MARTAPVTRRAGSARVPGRPGGGGRAPKPCPFCVGGSPWVDYKDLRVLRSFVSDRGKIKPRRSSGACACHQRDVTMAIKTARELALLPYAERTEIARGHRRSTATPMTAQQASVGATDEEA